MRILGIDPGTATVGYGIIEENNGQVEVVTYFKGQRKRSPHVTKVKAGKRETIKLNGPRGYCRVQAQTVGQSGERFCCFTNPIWIRVVDGSRKQIRVTFNS